MAATAISLTKVPLNDGITYPAYSALDGTDGALIEFGGQDTKTLILVQNSNSSAAKTVTFKAGTGIQGVADLAVEIPASTVKAFVLESGAFKSAGKVKVTGVADLKVAALLLP